MALNQTYSYQSIANIIDDLTGRYQRINETYPLDKNNAVEWATDCLRQIGGGITQEFIYHTKVKNNIIQLPDNVDKIDGVYMSKDCNIQQIAWQNSHLYALKLVGSVKSNLLCKDCCNTMVKDSRDTVSINYPYLVFNFTDNWVVVDYYGFQKDEDGLVMYPDEPSVKEALKNYILYHWLREPYLLNEISQYLYKDIEKDKDKYISQAKSAFVIPDVMQARGIIERNNNRYAKFQLTRYRITQ
jgi:hypothetical protein